MSMNPSSERLAFEAAAREEWDGKSIPDAAWIGWQLRARAALSTQPQQAGWMPIETAPKDGTVILIWRYYVCAVQWAPDEEWSWLAMPLGATYGPFEENAFKDGDPAITHWMPLPPVPGQEGGGV